MDSRSGSHPVYTSEYHFVWVTTYRDKVLTGNGALRVRELGQQTCELFESKLLQGVVRKVHGHLLVSAPPHMAPSAIMRRLKGRTSRQLCEACPRLNKRSWGRPGGARGSVCAPVGPRTNERGQDYWAHPVAPDRPDNFRTES